MTTAAGGNHYALVGVMRGLKQRFPSSPRLIISDVQRDGWEKWRRRRGEGGQKNMISKPVRCVLLTDQTTRISYLHVFANDARACDVMTAI